MTPTIRQKMSYTLDGEWLLFDEDTWVTSSDGFTADPSEPPREGVAKKRGLLRWNPPRDGLAEVRKLRCYVTVPPPPRAFPSLPHFVALEELAMPALWLEHLTTADVPPSLRLLWLDRKPSKWPAELVLPSLDFLIYVDGVRYVSPASVPNLRGLTVQIGAKNAAATEAYGAWPKLAGVHLYSVNEPMTLSALPLPQLEYLGVDGGKLETIESLAGSGLRSIHLKNLPKLGSIRSLAGAASLEEVDIQGCKRITDIEVLLDLPNLRRVVFRDCGKIGLKKLLADLEAKCSSHRDAGPLANGVTLEGTT